jgi:lysophospholipase L1-like esterase
LTPAKRAVFAAIMLAVPITAALLLGEAALRWLSPTPTSRDDLARGLAQSAATEVTTTDNLRGLVEPDPAPEVIYRLKRQRRWIFRGAPVSTNALGLRGPETTLAKPAGTRRIAGLGDSVMFGWGVDDTTPYITQLQPRLVRTLGHPVEALNFGVPGYNSRQEAALLRARVLAFQPDVLVLGYCLNDWAAPFFLPDPQRGGLAEKSLLLRVARRLAYPEGSEVAAEALADIAGMARAAGVPVVFSVFPQRADAHTLEGLRTLAAGHGWQQVDLYAAYERHLRAHGLDELSDLYVRPDDPHPDAVGHRLIAEALAPAVTRALRP